MLAIRNRKVIPKTKVESSCHYDHTQVVRKFN